MVGIGAISEIQVRIGADTSPLRNAIGQAKSDVRGFGSSIKRLLPSPKFLAVGAVAAIAGIGVAAIKAAIDFESAFGGVRKTVDATEEQFRELEMAFRDMATQIPVTAGELATIGEAAGQLGIDLENIEEFTRVMADLGVATNLSSVEAATALARLANITQMPQDEFDRLGSVIVELGNNMATTEAEIVEMGLRMAGAGVQVGLTEGEILAFAAALSSLGIQAQAGGTAFSKVFLEMNSAVKSTTEEGQENLANFGAVAGMSSDEFKEAFETDAAGAMIVFLEGLKRMSNEGKDLTGVLQEMGLADFRVRDALLRASSAGDLLRTALDLQSTAWEENIALTEEAEKRYGLTAGQIQIMKNQLNETFIQLGEKLLPTMIESIPVLTDLAIVFGDVAVPITEELIPALETLVAILANAVNGFREFKDDITGLWDAIPDPLKDLISGGVGELLEGPKKTARFLAGEETGISGLIGAIPKPGGGILAPGGAISSVLQNINIDKIEINNPATEVDVQRGVEEGIQRSLDGATK